MGSRWYSGRALRLHLTAIVVVPGCLVLGWWQVHRALSGNTLSWAYAVEWPVFAGYGVYLWWKLVHEEPTAPATEPEEEISESTPAPGPQAAGATHHLDESEEDAELAAYNRYLSELNAADNPKRW